jgi:hypothetical protein
MPMRFNDPAVTLGALFTGRHIGLPLRNTLRSDAVGMMNPLAGQGANTLRCRLGSDITNLKKIATLRSL